MIGPGAAGRTKLAVTVEGAELAGKPSEGNTELNNDRRTGCGISGNNDGAAAAMALMRARITEDGIALTIAGFEPRVAKKAITVVGGRAVKREGFVAKKLSKLMSAEGGMAVNNDGL